MPTVTVRAYGGQIYGGGSYVGASLASAVSDDSDATYAVQPGTETIELDYNIPALPAGAMWSTVQLRMRARMSTSNGSRLVQCVVWIGGDTFGTTWVGVTGNTFITFTLPAAVGPAAYFPVTMIETKITPSQVYAAGDFLLAETWLDFVYATQPVADVTAPTGTLTTRSTAEVTWTHTPGTDGGAQTRYRVKVFSAAQYGAGGFDPETSTATWDSGEVAGGASAATSPSLADGTYRAYVKTAQTVAGQSHWSAWDFSEFVVDVDRPELVSLTATPDAANGRIRLVATHDTSTAVDWQTLDVEASHDGGATWQPVYGAEDAPTPLNTWIGYDYEAPNGVTVVYRARASAVVSGQTVTGAYVESNTTAWAADTVWLKHLSDPALSRALCLRDLPNGESFARTQGVHAVLGRPGFIVTSDVLHTRVGTFSVLTETTAERDELHALLAEGSPLLLQIPESIGGFEQLYIVAGSIGRTRAPGAERANLPHRVHSIPFVEIDRPVLDIPPRMYGETFADALELGGTFADETGTFEELI